MATDRAIARRAVTTHACKDELRHSLGGALAISGTPCLQVAPTLRVTRYCNFMQLPGIRRIIMKKIIAIALLGTLPLVAPVQAQEAASFKAWTSKHSTTLGSNRPQKPVSQRPSKQRPQIERHTRPANLEHASIRLERLERQHSRLEQDLRRAKRHHASRSEIRHLRVSLHRVSNELLVAKRAYQHLLKRTIGARPFRLLLQHTAWLSDHQRPRPVQQTGHGRPNRRN